MAFTDVIEGVPTWCYLSVLAATLAYWVGTSTHDTFKKMGIPYSKPWPFVGTMLTIFSKTLPELDMDFIRTVPDRIAGSFQGMTPVLDCADVDFIKEVTIKQFPKFTDRRNIFSSENSKVLRLQIFTLQGDHWKHVRSMLTPTFTSGKLKQMYPTINHCADKFVEHLATADGSPVVFKDYSAGYTMDVIASTAFGMDIDAQSKLDHPFIKHAGTFFGIPKNNNFMSKFKQAATIFAVLTLPPPVLKVLNPFGLSFLDQESIAYFENVVEQVLDSGDTDGDERKNFISICTEKLVDAKQLNADSIRRDHDGIEWSTEGLSRDEVTANAVSFFAAGYETTATALQFFFYAMAVYPDVQEKLYDVISEAMEDGNLSYEELQKVEYLDWCVNESLRMFPPALRFDRVAKEEVEICGTLLPKGQIVNCMTYAVHHNPEYWQDPESFKPERFSQENKTEAQQHAYLPFGSGGRNCVAMRLALLELKVAIVKLLIAFRIERTSETPEPGKLKFKKFSGFLQPADPLKVSAVPRKR